MILSISYIDKRSTVEDKNELRWDFSNLPTVLFIWPFQERCFLRTKRLFCKFLSRNSRWRTFLNKINDKNFLNSGFYSLAFSPIYMTLSLILNILRYFSSMRKLFKCILNQHHISSGLYRTGIFFKFCLNRKWKVDTGIRYLSTVLFLYGWDYSKTVIYISSFHWFWVES